MPTDRDPVLLILTLYRDQLAAEKMLPSLYGSMQPEDRIWISDATEGLHNPIPSLGGDKRLGEIRRYVHRIGLPQALNEGIQQALDHGFRYVGWVHPDMDFSADPAWISSCIDHLMDAPHCGKASPTEQSTLQDALTYAGSYTGSSQPVVGNACPWILRTSDCEALQKSVGHVFDPGYHLLLYEDWDMMNALFVMLGKVPHILPWSVVVHEGMGTRKDKDYGDALERNKSYYISKWGSERPLF